MEGSQQHAQEIATMIRVMTISIMQTTVIFTPLDQSDQGQSPSPSSEESLIFLGLTLSPDCFLFLAGEWLLPLEVELELLPLVGAEGFYW